jgi:hypothetical protein
MVAITLEAFALYAAFNYRHYPYILFIGRNMT